MFCTDCEIWDTGESSIPVPIDALSGARTDVGVEVFTPVGCVVAVLVEVWTLGGSFGG
jgi:hypothetical protein